MTVCWVVALLALPMLLAPAQELAPETEPQRLYQVELLVFKNLGTTPPGPQSRPGMRSQSQREIQRVEFVLMNPLRGEDAARILPQQQLELSSAWRRLERLPAYQPLLLTGWSQPVWDKDIAPAQAVAGGIDPQISGQVTFYEQRYLHLRLDMVVEELLLQSDPSLGRELVQVRFQGDRRVRIGETHFFDHPRFGVLARVERIEEPDSNKT